MCAVNVLLICNYFKGTGKWKVSAKIQQLLNTLKVRTLNKIVKSSTLASI